MTDINEINETGLNKVSSLQEDQIIESCKKYLQTKPNDVQGFYKYLSSTLGTTTALTNDLVNKLLETIFDTVTPSSYIKYGAAHKVYFASYLQALAGNIGSAKNHAAVEKALKELDAKYDDFLKRCMYHEGVLRLQKCHRERTTNMKNIGHSSAKIEEKLSREITGFISDIKNIPFSKTSTLLTDEDFTKAQSEVESYVSKIEAKKDAYREKELDLLNSQYSSYNSSINSIRSNKDTYRKADLKKLNEDFFKKAKKIKVKTTILRNKVIGLIAASASVIAVLSFVLIGGTPKVAYGVNSSGAEVKGVSGAIFSFTTGSIENVVIPETYDGKKVVSVGSHAFDEDKNLKSVYLPDSVNIIKDYAFAHCGNLESINFPAGLLEIDYWAFISDTSLKNVILNEGLRSIKNQAFSNCHNLESVYIPKSLITLDSSAFDFESSKLKINYGGSYEEFRKLYYNCSSLGSRLTCNAVTVTLQDSSISKNTFTLSMNDTYSFPVPTKEGYRFIGWFDGSTSSSVQYTDEKGNGLTVWTSNTSKTLVPHFELIEYAITYNLYGGEFVSTADSTFNVQDDFALAIPEKHGYTFDGWYLTSTFTNKVLTANDIYRKYSKIQNVQLYAKWVPNTYSIDYELDGGENSEENPLSYNYGSRISLEDPIKEHYDFDGWYLDEFFTEPFNSSNDYDHDLELYAKWTPTVYEITYLLNAENGEENDPRNPSSFAYGEDIPLYNCGSNSQLPVIGWKDENRNIIESTADFTDSFILTAVYVEGNTITYHLNGGTNSDENLPYYDISNSRRLSEPTKTGYEFMGWYTNSEFSTSITYTPNRDIGALDVYAKWEINTYNIDYMLDGGSNSVNNPHSFVYGSRIELEDPTKAHYDFDGWYLDELFTEQFNSGIKYDHDLVLHAKWTPIVYNITYVLNSENGEENDPRNPSSFAYGDEIPLYSCTSSLAQPVAGWQDEYGRKIRNTADFVDSYTLSAVYVEGGYITYDLDGGTNSSDNYDYYDIYSTRTLSDPVKTGYTFMGWYTDNEFATRIYRTPSSNVGTLILYAKWEVGVYNIAYHISSGTNSSANPSTYTYGETIYFEDPISNYGFDFLGWYLDSSYETEITDTSGLDGDIHLYAKWDVEAYYEVDQFYSSYGFNKDETINPDPSLYDGVYYSNNQGISSSYAVAKIKFQGFSQVNLYIRSYAESGCDFTIASILDASSYPTSSSGSNVKSSTNYSQSSSTYTLCSYNISDTNEHWIYVVYRKDSSVNSNSDTGYFYLETIL